MKLSIIVAALLAVHSSILALSAFASGLARSDNFIVMAPTQELAGEVLKAAEKYRQDVAVQWLGAPLPPSVGAAIIHVELSEGRDDGCTWAKDHPDRKHHSVYLTTSRARALGSTLKHEITHVVLATRYPKRLPIWLEEGCAGAADDGDRRKVRLGILDWYARTGNWPNLERVLNSKTMSASDRGSYAVACSLAEFLIERDGGDNLLAFGEGVSEQGLQQALSKWFGFRSVDELADQWQGWYTARRTVASNAQQKTR